MELATFDYRRNVKNVKGIATDIEIQGLLKNAGTMNATQTRPSSANVEPLAAAATCTAPR
jgi:hypothetical protein